VCEADIALWSSVRSRNAGERDFISSFFFLPPLRIRRQGIALSSLSPVLAQERACRKNYAMRRLPLSILLLLALAPLASSLTLRGAATAPSVAFDKLTQRVGLRRRRRALEQRATLSAQRIKLFVDPVERLDVLPALSARFEKRPDEFRAVAKVVHEAEKLLRHLAAKAKRQLGVLKFVDVVTNAQVSRHGGKVKVIFAAIFAKRGLRRGVVEREVAAEALLDGSSVHVEKLTCDKSEGWGGKVDVDVKH